MANEWNFERRSAPPLGDCARLCGACADGGLVFVRYDALAWQFRGAVVVGTSSQVQQSFPKARGATVSAGGRFLAIVESTSWQLVDRQTGEVHKTHARHGFGTTSREPVFSDDGSGIKVGGALRRWDGSVVRVGPVRELAAAGDQNDIGVWRTADDSEVARFPVKQATARATLRADGRFVTGYGIDGLFVFDVHGGGAPIASLPVRETGFTVAFAADGSVHALVNKHGSEPQLYSAYQVLPPIDGAAERDRALADRIASEAPPAPGRKRTRSK